jgi:formylglycine-generating enzyme required for sulfatase activity
MNRAPRTNLTALCRLIITLLAPVFSPDVGQANSEISFEWVTVGDPGNPNDPLTGAPTDYGPLPVRGAVPYAYSISKYETTIGQYAAFLNAVGQPGLYKSILSSRDATRGLTMVGTPGSYSFHVRNGISGLSSANLPITYITYLDAVRFVNWLHNGQGHGSPETGAYDISQGQITRLSRAGGIVTFTSSEPHSLQVGDWVSVTASGQSAIGYLTSFVVTARTNTTFSYSSGQSDLPEQEAPGSMIGVSARKPGARYWIPSENEWYKAAYYDPSPTGPEDDYWRFPWGVDEPAPGFGNYYVVRYITTSQIDFQPVDATYITDVRGGSLSPSGTINQAGNVEEWTEGDSFSGGPHTRGGWWDKSYAQSRPQTHAYHRMASYLINNTAPLPNDDGIGFRVATTANPPDGGLRNGDSIRFHPRTGHGARMVGGVFEGSDYGSSYTVLHTISQVPPNGWTDVSVNFDQFRYFRYRGPENSFGNVAEIEFYRSGAKVTAAASGTPGSMTRHASVFAPFTRRRSRTARCRASMLAFAPPCWTARRPIPGAK